MNASCASSKTLYTPLSSSFEERRGEKRREEKRREEKRREEKRREEKRREEKSRRGKMKTNARQGWYASLQALARRTVLSPDRVRQSFAFLIAYVVIMALTYIY